jgi:hypothetical protein
MFWADFLGLGDGKLDLDRNGQVQLRQQRAQALQAICDCLTKMQCRPKINVALLLRNDLVKGNVANRRSKVRDLT